MMSSFETSSPVSASTLAYLTRWPVFLLIWLKLIFSESEVAGYNATGQVTRERRKKPFQLARGAIRGTPNATGELVDSRRSQGIRSDNQVSKSSSCKSVLRLFLSLSQQDGSTTENKVGPVVRRERKQPAL